MSDTTCYALLGLIIFLTHFQEGITGFGCTVLALPFVMLLLGLDQAVKVLVIQAWVLAFCIVIISRHRIMWSEYWRIVIPASAGLVIGIWMSSVLPETKLKWILAFFMMAVGIRGLLAKQEVQSAKIRINKKTRWLLSSFLPIGGIMQGAFGSGGPFVVIYATRMLREKSLFRVTLCMLWFTLNSMLIAQWSIHSALTGKVFLYTAFCLPFTLIGLVFGDKAHHRINEILFRRIVYAVLLVSGLALIWTLMR